MKRNLLLLFLLVLFLIGGLALYVGLNARRELRGAQQIFAGSVDDLTAEDIAEGTERLEAARGYLRGIPASVVRVLPVARQNVQALEAVVTAGLPVLADAGALTEARQRIQSSDLVLDGRVRLELLRELEDPLDRAVARLRTLERALERHRSGWLLPPLWEAMDEFARRAQTLRASAENARRGLEVAGPLLGADGTRAYLVVLLNNAELRGAGGLLSSVGTMSAQDGRLDLGSFHYHGDINTKPLRDVEAPADFERRFGRYRAASTAWVNASASPDVPEFAVVASRLFEEVEGQETDGVVVIDPRGIEAMLSEDAEVPVTGTDVTLARESFADFIYSDSYDVLGGWDPRRRRAILSVGQAAFAEILKGSGGAELLDSAAAAVAGGHIRFVSFDPAEQEVLDRLGVAGSLETDALDSVLVTVQNFGADKLDFWMRRSLEHTCRIHSAGFARCRTTVAMTNETPMGLNEYVTQIADRDKRDYSYGVYLGYLEAYVPEDAELTGVTLNGRTHDFYPETEDGRKALGMYFATERGATTTLEVSYDLEVPPEGYSLEVTPQPLTSDAHATVDLTGLSDWMIEGPGTQTEKGIRFDGPLDRALRFELRPAGRTGFAALWRALVRFWTEPLA